MKTQMGWLQNAALPALVLIVFVSLSACFNNKPPMKGDLRSVAVRSRNDESLDLPILKSFGFSSVVIQRELAVPLPEGGVQTAVSLGCLDIAIRGKFAGEAEKLLPLYSSATQSKVIFSDTVESYDFSDFLAPAIQATLNSEFRFQNKSAKLTSTDALFSVLASDGRIVRFSSTKDANLQSLLTDGLNFRVVGDLQTSIQRPQASQRERNSGFAVGDLLVITEGGSLKHTALWLDHDLLFEALPFGNSVLFRLSSYSQLVEELALRSTGDLQKMHISNVRKVSSWPETVNRLRAMNEQVSHGVVYLLLDKRGRGLVTSTQGVAATPRLQERVGVGASRPDSPQ